MRIGEPLQLKSAMLLKKRKFDVVPPRGGIGLGKEKVPRQGWGARKLIIPTMRGGEGTKIKQFSERNTGWEIIFKKLARRVGGRPKAR